MTSEGTCLYVGDGQRSTDVQAETNFVMKFGMKFGINGTPSVSRSAK